MEWQEDEMGWDADEKKGLGIRDIADMVTLSHVLLDERGNLD